MPFYLIFIIIPLIEIGLFIEVGDQIGLGRTLLLCFLTAIIGAFLIRAQGIRTLLNAQAALQKMQMPMAEIFDGICLVLAGGLLLTPGFFTDSIGFALLVPGFRGWLRQHVLPWIADKAGFQTVKRDETREQETNFTVIDAEYEIIDPDEEDS